jgi:hypothetical protein
VWVDLWAVQTVSKKAVQKDELWVERMVERWVVSLAWMWVDKKAD